MIETLPYATQSRAPTRAARLARSSITRDWAVSWSGRVGLGHVGVRLGRIGKLSFAHILRDKLRDIRPQEKGDVKHHGCCSNHVHALEEAEQIVPLMRVHS